MNVGVFFCVGGWVVCGGGGINYHAFYTVIVLKSAECWVVSQDFYTCSYCFLVSQLKSTMTMHSSVTVCLMPFRVLLLTAS